MNTQKGLFKNEILETKPIEIPSVLQSIEKSRDSFVILNSEIVS